MTKSTIKFPNRNQAQFVDELKHKVAEYFETKRVSPKANQQMVFKTLIMVGITYGAYGLILTNLFSPWQMLALAVMVGAGFAGVGFNISHDALHSAYSSSPRVNKLLGLTFDMIGANGYMWKLTHNIIHHTYTNIPGIDEDLEVSPLIRLSPQAKLKSIHKYQHILAFFAYGLATLFWVFIKDYKYFLQRDLGPYKNKVHALSEIITLIITKIFYYTYTIVIPLLVLDIAWWQFVIGFMAMHFTAGLILGVVFQLAHVVEGPEYLTPDGDGLMEHLWMAHQLKTTANFATTNTLLSWYVGGLNFQIEHHLFPQICSVHYPAISGIVQEVIKKYEMPYNYHNTLSAAIRSHYIMLKRLGNPSSSTI